MKTKIKEKFEEHKTTVARIGTAIMAAGLLAIGYRVGFAAGAGCFYGSLVHANPDLAQPINEIIMK